MRTRSWRGAWCLSLAVLCVALPLAVERGLLDRWLPGGAAGRQRALLAALVYGALSWLATGIVLAWPRRRRTVLAALLGTVLACLAFDVAARALALRSGIPRVGTMGMSSRTLHHAYPPESTLRLGTLAGDLLVVRTNEDGLRTAWDRASFLAHRPRIAIVGDSFVFGLGVPQGKEFPVLLEDLLRERTGEPRLAVLNAGVVSYSPFLERWQFEDSIRHYRPELVVLVIDVTDIGDDLRYESEARLQDGRPVFESELADVASFRDWGPFWTLTKPLRQVLDLPFAMLARARDGARPGGPPAFRFDLQLEGVRETNQYFLYRHPLEVTRPWFERTLQNVVALAQAVDAAGARFAAVVIPRFQHWNPAECPDNWEQTSYARNEPFQFEYFRFFDEARSRVAFPILSLLSAFQATDEFPLVLPDDPHWNEAGHAFVARTLAEILIEQDLVPR